MRVEQLERGLALEAFAMAESLVEDIRRGPSPEDTPHWTRTLAISAYDAEFVLAARRLGVPLVTTGKRLIRTFPDQVVPLDKFGVQT